MVAQMTKIEILNEVADDYSKDVTRRSIKLDCNGLEECLYLAENGNRCGVGKYMHSPEDFRDQNVEVFEIASCLSELSTEDSIDEHLFERAKGHCIDFWCDVQSFHDTSENWDLDKGKGLTKAGEGVFSELKEIWK